MCMFRAVAFVFFFFNDTATTEIYTLSLHDALPICDRRRAQDDRGRARAPLQRPLRDREPRGAHERRVGEGGGPGALARPGAPVHEEPPPRPLPANLVRPWSPDPTASS